MRGSREIGRRWRGRPGAQVEWIVAGYGAAAGSGLLVP